MMKRAIVVVMLVSLGFLVACGGPATPPSESPNGTPEPDPSVSAVSVSPASFVLEAGESLLLTVTLDADEGADTTVVWSSSDTAVVTVNQAGNVLAVRPGSAVVKATSVAGGLAGEAAGAVVLTQGVTFELDPGFFEPYDEDDGTGFPYTVIGAAMVFPGPLILGPGIVSLTSIEDTFLVGELVGVEGDGAIRLPFPELEDFPPESFGNGKDFLTILEEVEADADVVCEWEPVNETVALTRVLGAFPWSIPGVFLMTYETGLFGLGPFTVTDRPLSGVDEDEVEGLPMFSWVHAARDVRVGVECAGGDPAATVLSVDLDLVQGWNVIRWRVTGADEAVYVDMAPADTELVITHPAFAS